MSSAATLVIDSSSDVLILSVEKDCDCLCLGGGKASKLKRQQREQPKAADGEKDKPNRVADVSAEPDTRTVTMTDLSTMHPFRQAAGYAKSPLSRSLSQPAGVGLSPNGSSVQPQQDALLGSGMPANGITADNSYANSTTCSRSGYPFDWLTPSELDSLLFDGNGSHLFTGGSTDNTNAAGSSSAASQSFSAGADTNFDAGSSPMSSTVCHTSPAVPTGIMNNSNTVFTDSPAPTAATASATSLTALDIEKDSPAAGRSIISSADCPSTSSVHPSALVSPPPMSSVPPHLAASSTSVPSANAAGFLNLEQNLKSPFYPPSSYPARSLSRSFSQPVGVGASIQTNMAANVFYDVQQGGNATTILPEPATQPPNHLVAAAQVPVLPQQQHASGGLHFEPPQINSPPLSGTSANSTNTLLPPGAPDSGTFSSSQVSSQLLPSVSVGAASGVGVLKSQSQHRLAPTDSVAVGQSGIQRPQLFRALGDTSRGGCDDLVRDDERLARKLQEEEFVKGMRGSKHHDERLAMSLLAKDLAIHRKRNDVLDIPMATGNGGQFVQPPPVSMNSGSPVSICDATNATSSENGAVLNNSSNSLAGELRQPSATVGGGSTKYPKCWSECPNCPGDSTHKYHLIDVEHGSPEWDTVSRPLTQAGFNVVSVQRIQNETLWQRLCFEKQQMLKVRPSCNERFLYHTSRAEVSVICEEGLDPRLSQNGLFGTGIYFSDNPVKCDKYWPTKDKSERTMFCCRVLLGDTKVYPKGQHERLRREPRAYDSVKGNVTGQDEYVVYNAYRVMPEYVMKYYTSTSEPQTRVCRIAQQRWRIQRICSRTPYFHPGLFQFPPHRTPSPLYGGHINYCPHGHLSGMPGAGFPLVPRTFSPPSTPAGPIPTFAPQQQQATMQMVPMCQTPKSN